MASLPSSTLLQWARGLRFPTLFMITAGLFLLNLVLIDPIPFVDELLFGLVTLLLANWKRRKGERDLDAPSEPARVVADYPQSGRRGISDTAPPPLPDDTHGR